MGSGATQMPQQHSQLTSCGPVESRSRWRGRCRTQRTRRPGRVPKTCLSRSHWDIIKTFSWKSSFAFERAFSGRLAKPPRLARLGEASVDRLSCRTVHPAQFASSSWLLPSYAYLIPPHSLPPRLVICARNLGSVPVQPPIRDPTCQPIASRPSLRPPPRTVWHSRH